MITILVDKNIEGQALLLWRMLSMEGWPELLSMELALFSQVGLRENSNDREVWQFAQNNRMILLTANRNMKGKDSLEQIIREANTATSLPVLTIGNVDGLSNADYREDCITRWLEIVADIENYLGARRIYIP